MHVAVINKHGHTGDFNNVIAIGGVHKAGIKRAFGAIDLWDIGTRRKKTVTVCLDHVCI
jgi:hypothetical protein